MTKAERLTAYITDLQAGGGLATRHFSPEFGRHRGLDGPGWVAREEAEFAGKSLGKFRIQLIPDDDGLALAETRYSVLNEAGTLVYDDRIGFDDNGLLMGDQAPVELVSKLELRKDRSCQRALACRVPKGKLLRVVPRDRNVTSVEIVQAAAEHSDGFTRLRVTLKEDNARACLVTLRFYFDWGAETVTTLLRGAEHPSFETDNWASIKGTSIQLPPTSYVWRATVIFEDDTTEVLIEPTAQQFKFDKPVSRVILTDRLDNDWISDAPT